MAPINKLARKTKTFLWIEEYQKAWQLIEQKYVEAPILISPNWQVAYHVHKDASLLDVGAMLFHNVTRKSDQPIVYVFRILHIAKLHYSTTNKKVLIMVFALHKFKHYLLGNKSFFYVDHMALVYLVKKPQVSGRITKWLLFS
jgi:hypothetical protein